MQRVKKLPDASNDEGKAQSTELFLLPIVLCPLLILFFLTAFGALANLGLAGTYQGTGSPTDIKEAILCSILAVSFAGMTLYLLYEGLLSDSGGERGFRVVIRAALSKWKVITAAAVPVAGLYKFGHYWGLKPTLPQILGMIGVYAAMALPFTALLAVLFAVFFAWSKVLQSLWLPTAAIVTIGLLIYIWPPREFLTGPPNPWANIGFAIFAGAGLSLVFGLYFILIWKPLSEWLKS